MALDDRTCHALFTIIEQTYRWRSSKWQKQRFSSFILCSMITDTRQIGGRCHMYDYDRGHICGNFYRTTFTNCGKFLWGVNFVTVRAVTKITKISPPQNYPLYGRYVLATVLKVWVHATHNNYTLSGKIILNECTGVRTLTTTRMHDSCMCVDL